MKNIRNNLLNGKKFVFPKFIYNDGLNTDINFPAGFFQWKDCTISMKKTKDCQPIWIRLPNFNKQNVPLALAIVYENTITAARSYFPNQSDLSVFFNSVYIWWIISSSKQRYTPNVLGNAIIFGGKTTDFYRIFADWIELWRASPSFKLTCQTKLGLVTILLAQANLF